jgi:hypothetical protein
MDQETWRFINTFAPWLAALGTFSAVVVSLYLARKSNQIELEVRAGLRNIAFIEGMPVAGPPPGNFQPAPLLVWVGITNLGRRSAHIVSVYWKPLPWRKRGIVWFPPQNNYSSRFPITLDDGQSANYSSPVPEFEKSFTKHFRHEFSGFFGAIRLRLLRVGVGTSTGEVFRCKPEKELRALLRKMAMAQKAEKREQ